jgi:delta-aminolevulinic acid dehydratase/porphobilinogen synthase
MLQDFTGIMSYSKYASAFYGPFRDALDSAQKTQM